MEKMILLLYYISRLKGVYLVIHRGGMYRTSSSFYESTTTIKYSIPITMLPTVNKTEQYFIVKNHSLYMTMKNISTSVCNPYHPCA